MKTLESLYRVYKLNEFNRLFRYFFNDPRFLKEKINNEPYNKKIRIAKKSITTKFNLKESIRAVLENPPCFDTSWFNDY